MTRYIKKLNNKEGIIIFSLLLFLIFFLYLNINRQSYNNHSFLFDGTGIEAPESAKNIIYKEETGNFLGDGYIDLYLEMSDIDYQKMLLVKPFGKGWRHGSHLEESVVYQEIKSLFVDLYGAAKHDNIYYSFEFKNPDNIEYDKSYRVIILDPKNKSLFIRESRF